jgi:uncharacterized coiled-coil DUF342 family protein
MIPNTNIKEINDYISQLLDACRDYRKELDEKTKEVERLREESSNWHRHYRDEANNAQKFKQAYIELEKEVERLHDYIKRVLLLLDSDLPTKEAAKFWDEYESQYGKIQ